MSDLIDRQVAIDAINSHFGFNIEEEYGSAVQEVINGLPSAQPEPIKINIEDFNKEDWERLKKEWGNTPITVLPAQPKNENLKFLEFLWNTINPNEMEQYLEMYSSKEVKSNG